MKMKREYLELYLVMGSPNCNGKNPLAVLEAAIEGGVTLFQFREKGIHAAAGEEKRKLAWQLKEKCHQYGVPFIVNDEVELAVEVDADGVHIGQDDSAIERVRELFPGKIIGVSCHSVEEADAAVRKGADYIGVGPMFFTSTKKDILEVRGPIVIKEIREAGFSVPIVGIGGITNENVRDVWEAGADGVAMISAIAMADSPKQAAQSIRDIFTVLKN